MSKSKSNPRNIEVGDTVRMTRDFLRSTGQYSGHDCHAKWKVTSIIEGGGMSLIVTDEKQSKHNMEYYTEDEIKADPTLWFRRINAANLEKVKA